MSVLTSTLGLFTVTFQVYRLLIFVSPFDLHNLSAKSQLFKIVCMDGSQSANQICEEVIDQSREDRGFLLPIPLILSFMMSSICDDMFELNKMLFTRSIYLRLM